MKYQQHIWIKPLIILGLGLSICNDAIGQKSFLLSMPENNIYSFNPGYAGLERSLDVAVWSRQQWQGIPGRPTSLALAAHLPMYHWSGGVGLRLFRDQLGPFSYVKMELGYSYVQANDERIWTLGVTGGWQQVSFDGSLLRTADGVYTAELVDHQDPNLPNTSLSYSAPTISFGTYLVTPSFEGGLSVEDVVIGAGSFQTQGLNFNWIPALHITGYFVYPVAETYDWRISPMLFVQSDLEDIQVLLKGQVSFRDVWHGGIGIRGYSNNTLESAVISLGHDVDKHLSIFYSYDLGLQGIAGSSNGSHELILRYNLRKPIGRSGVPKVIGNPRVLK